MSTKTITRIFSITIFALLFGFLATVVSADASKTVFAKPDVQDCHSCHRIIQDAWEQGSHGIAGVECQTCHSPVAEAHPQEVMPTDISSRLCGTCHTTTDEEFEDSVHGEEDLTCVRCHNSHTTHIRTETVQDLCQNCHQDITHFFKYSTHAEQNLYCTDCHLPVDTGEDREGIGDRVHSFAVDFASCKNCHDEDIHIDTTETCTEEMLAEAEQNGEEPPCSPETISTAGINIPQESGLSMTPGSTNPVGFAIVGTLIGVVAGMILSPFLEKWFERLQR